MNAPGIGIRVTTNATSNGAVNSGPYRDLTVQYISGQCSACNGNTVGLQIDGTNYGGVIRGFDNVTVSGNTVTTQLGSSAYGIFIYGASTTLTNSHVEFFPTGIEIGG